MQDLKEKKEKVEEKASRKERKKEVVEVRRGHLPTVPPAPFLGAPPFPDPSHPLRPALWPLTLGGDGGWRHRATLTPPSPGPQEEENGAEEEEETAEDGEEEDEGDEEGGEGQGRLGSKEPSGWV